jgi:hypothetical protein
VKRYLMFKAPKDGVFLRPGKGGEVEVHIQEEAFSRWVDQAQQSVKAAARALKAVSGLWAHLQAAERKAQPVLPAPGLDQPPYILAAVRSSFDAASMSSEQLDADRERFYTSLGVPADREQFGEWRKVTLAVGARTQQLLGDWELELLSVGTGGATFQWRNRQLAEEAKKGFSDES